MFINPPRKKGVRIIAFFSCGYIVYELIQPFLPRGVFDWKDVFGTLIGGILALLIYLTLNRLVNNKVLKKF